MEPIECEIMQVLREIDQFITDHPNFSAKDIYDQKEVELISKYGPQLVAKFLPEFESRDNTIFRAKYKSVPKLPTNINDLTD